MLQTNRQKRSTGSLAKLKGDALLKVLNRIVKELQNIRAAIISKSQVRKGKKFSSKKSNKKKGKGKKKRKGKKLSKNKGTKKGKKNSKKKKKGKGKGKSSKG